VVGDQGDPGVARRQLADPAYEPLCKGMAAALPYVDYFLPFANLGSVQSLGKTLLRLRR